jgi:hypothetical protein
MKGAVFVCGASKASDRTDNGFNPEAEVGAGGAATRQRAAAVEIYCSRAAGETGRRTAAVSTASGNVKPTK